MLIIWLLEINLTTLPLGKKNERKTFRLHQKMCCVFFFSLFFSLQDSLASCAMLRLKNISDMQSGNLEKIFSGQMPQLFDHWFSSSTCIQGYHCFSLCVCLLFKKTTATEKQNPTFFPLFLLFKIISNMENTICYETFEWV